MVKFLVHISQYMPHPPIYLKIKTNFFSHYSMSPHLHVIQYNNLVLFSILYGEVQDLVKKH